MFTASLWCLPLLLLESVYASSHIASAWYAGWHSEQFPLSKVSWSKYTHLTYAFATPASDGTITLEDSDKAFLPKFVAEAHKHGVVASLSIGGWGGSIYWSSGVGSSQNRTVFVDQILDIVDEYALDGVDFDWEYPDRQGMGCNTISIHDSENLLSMLQELRGRPLGKNLTLSAATSLKPFNDSSNTPMTDVSAFADVLDYIAIMNYDVQYLSPPSLGVGPSAPLDDSCEQEVNQHGSATSAVQAWGSAGMPHGQMVLGVASYGHSYHVNNTSAFQDGTKALKAYPSYSPTAQGKGDRWDGDGGLDACGVEQGPGGIFNFWGLQDGGFIDSNGSAVEGIAYRFDNCSQTPYVYNAQSEVMVSYDNPESFSIKGDFIAANGLKGFAMWEAGGDSDDLLLDSILSALTAPSASSTGSNTSSVSSDTPSSTATFQPSASSSSSLGSPAIFPSRDILSCFLMLQVLLVASYL